MCTPKNCQFLNVWNAKLEQEHKKLSKLMDMWDNFDDHLRTYPLKDPNHVRQVTDNLRKNRVRNKEQLLTSINQILKQECPECKKRPKPKCPCPRY